MQSGSIGVGRSHRVPLLVAHLPFRADEPAGSDDASRLVDWTHLARAQLEDLTALCHLTSPIGRLSSASLGPQGLWSRGRTRLVRRRRPRERGTGVSPLFLPRPPFLVFPRPTLTDRFRFLVSSSTRRSLTPRTPSRSSTEPPSGEQSFVIRPDLIARVHADSNIFTTGATSSRSSSPMLTLEGEVEEEEEATAPESSRGKLRCIPSHINPRVASVRRPRC